MNEIYDTFESAEYGEFFTGPYTKIIVSVSKANFAGQDKPVWLFNMWKWRKSKFHGTWYALKGSGTSFPVEGVVHLFEILQHMKESGVFEWVEKRTRSNDEGTI